MEINTAFWGVKNTMRDETEVFLWAKPLHHYMFAVLCAVFCHIFLNHLRRNILNMISMETEVKE